MGFGYAVYFTERPRNRVIRWDPDTGNAQVVAGQPKDGNPEQTLADPYGLSFDKAGNLLIADKLHNRICRLRKGRLDPLLLKDTTGHRAPLPTSRQGYDPTLRCPTGLFREEESDSLLCTFADDYTVYRIYGDGRLELLLGIVRNRNYHFGGAEENVPPGRIKDTPINVPVGIVKRSDGTIFFIERIPQVVREFHPSRGLRCIFPLSRQSEFYLKTAAPRQAAIKDYHPAVPGALALDSSERLYMTDVRQSCVIEIDLKAGEIHSVIQQPKGNHLESGIGALTFGKDGTAWVVNSAAGAVEAYATTRQGPWKATGTRLTKIGGETLQLPDAGSGIITGA